MARKIPGFLTRLKKGGWFFVGDAKVIAEEVRSGEVVFRVVAPREMKIVHRGTTAFIEPKEADGVQVVTGPFTTGGKP